MMDVTPTAVLVPRDVVAVVGTDARRFLHGQLSQDVEGITVGSSRWTLALAPNGRVEVLARVRCVDEERFELDVEPGFGGVLAARLERFRIRVKADIHQASVTLGAPVGAGERSQQETAEAAHQRAYVGWWDVGEWLAEAASGATGTADDYEIARVAAGWPAMGAEILPGERLPAEIGVAAVAVNFTKGCYPGQELVERMDSRGSQAPRQLRIVPADAGERPGDAILAGGDAEGGAGGDPVGVITSVAGGLALAYVKRGTPLGEVPGPTSA